MWFEVGMIVACLNEEENRSLVHQLFEKEDGRKHLVVG